MNAFSRALRRLLRGPAASRLLTRLGLDVRRYWLLMDLFGKIADRGEVMDQLGWSGSALKTASSVYCLITGLLTVLMMFARPAPLAFSAIFLAMTVFLMLTVLFSEAGNSLANPAEGLILAHQPIDGATYTAAKLSHLLRIILYLVPSMNALPALAGLMLKGTDLRFPLLHMGAALGAGVLAALLTCSVYGWLLRFIPAKRVRSAAQIAGGAPFLIFMIANPTRHAARFASRWLPHNPAVKLALWIALGAVAIAIVVFGIRSLTADYLIRVSRITRGGGRRRRGIGRARVANLVARIYGGPGARAGFAYVSQIAIRDYQIRRQVMGLIPMMVMMGASVFKSMSSDPFSGKFVLLHIAPHMLGFMLIIVCALLPYGGEYKGAWIFQLAPVRILGRFARGVHAFLWIAGALTPHLVLFLPLAWFWGVWHAALFVLFSLAVTSLYLGFALRLIESVPFSQKPEAKGGAMTLPVMLLVFLAAGIASAVQHLLLFRSEAAVLAATAVLGMVAWFLTLWSLGAFAQNMRFSLGLISGESKLIYEEVD